MMQQTTVHTTSTSFRVSGLTCADCAEKLAQQLRMASGISEVSLNFLSGKLVVRHQVTPSDIIRIVEHAGYRAQVEGTDADATRHSFLQTHHRLLTTMISALLLAVAWGFSHTLATDISIPLYIAAILVGGLWTIRRGVAALRHGIFDMNALMTIAVVGACVIGEWNEAATVAVLFSVSNMLESYTMEKTRQSLRGLMELSPREARVRRDGIERAVPIEELRLGDLVVVKPGEKIAIDGVIARGQSAVNEAPITGESLPVEKQPGDGVFAGTVNEFGTLDVQVTHLADDTALARIIHLVEEAQTQRAPSQAFVDRFARYYTPIVLIVAVGIAIIPPLVFQQPWGDWVYRALTLIVVACPCALVISTPVAIVSAIGNAARHGVLIKGGAYLEEMGRIRVMAFDKTGTLTIGRPVITETVPANGIEPDAILALAAAVERGASHPLASAVVTQAEQRGIVVPEATDFASLPGRGAQAMVDGAMAYIGNRRFFDELGMVLPADEMISSLERSGMTVMLVGREGGQFLGAIAAADTPRAGAAQTVRELYAAGIKDVVMLTGDHRETARVMADHVGIDIVHANLLPDGKAAAIAELRRTYGTVGMVGDGVNDAPALATASVGLAMGVAGTGTALETADIALMTDDLAKLPYIVRLSRGAVRIIKENIAVALLIKAVALLLIFPGWLTLWMAVLADMGASIVVTLNGLRMMRGATLGDMKNDDCHHSHHHQAYAHTSCCTMDQTHESHIEDSPDGNPATKRCDCHDCCQ